MGRTPPKDDEGYAFIRNKLVHTGKPPSLRTIAAFLGYKSPRSVQLMLERLNKDGRIYYADGKISLVHHHEMLTGEQTVDIPMVGTAACGALTMAEQVVDNYLKVSTKLATPGYQYFILKAKGDSMNLSGINDGDLLLVRQQPDARDGQIVVALVDDEVTVKHFHRQNGVIILKPNSSDPSFKPIILSDRLIVQGVVVKTIPNPF